MSRRSRRPKLLADDAPIESGWTRHDGCGCPVSLSARPALLFRSGTKIALDAADAEHWETFEDGSCWDWFGREPNRFDILAYWFGD